MTVSIAALQDSAFNWNPAEERITLLMSAKSIEHNGHVYKSLADHDPHSTTAVTEYNKLYSLDPAWELCPNTPDALHVCKTYPWAAYALIFADGSAHWTKKAPSASSSLTPGAKLNADA